MLKDVAKGYNFYPKSAMRELIVCSGMAVKECNNLVESTLSYDTLVEEFDKAEGAIEKFTNFASGSKQQPKVVQTVNVKDLKKALDGYTKEFIDIGG